jgi:hypothetical protein
MVCRPLTAIRDNLLSPNTDPYLTPNKLSSLLQWHLPHLQQPSSPFAPSSSKRPSITNQTQHLTIPRTNSKLTIDDSTRTLALRLADRAQIDEVDAYILVASYKAHALDVEGNEDEGVWLWFSAEVVAVGGIVMALDRLRREEYGVWSDMAGRIRNEVVGDEGQYIRSLFMGWSGLAQSMVGTQVQEQIQQW